MLAYVSPRASIGKGKSVRTYSKILPTFWQGKSARILRRHPDAQRLALYLRTCPASNMLGLYALGEAAILGDLGLTPAALEAAWSVLRDLGLADYDDDAEVVWLPGEAYIQVAPQLTARDNRSTGLSNLFRDIPECRFIESAYAAYAGPLGLCRHPTMPPTDSTESPSEAPSEPLRSQDQDQEQKQKQQPQPPPVLDPSPTQPTVAEPGGGGVMATPIETVPAPRSQLAPVVRLVPDPSADPVETRTAAEQPAAAIERPVWRRPRPLAGLADAEPLTTLDLDAALRGLAWSRGTMTAWRRSTLGELHDESPLTAGELRYGIEAVRTHGAVDQPLRYAAACVRSLRDGTARPTTAAATTATRTTTPQHVRERQATDAWLELQQRHGYPRDLDRARQEAVNGVPVEGDEETYARAGGDWAALDGARQEAMRRVLAMVAGL